MSIIGLHSPCHIKHNNQIYNLYIIYIGAIYTTKYNLVYDGYILQRPCFIGQILLYL
jgi:hypothetical protein